MDESKKARKKKHKKKKGGQSKDDKLVARARARQKAKKKEEKKAQPTLAERLVRSKRTITTPSHMHKLFLFHVSRMQCKRFLSSSSVFTTLMMLKWKMDTV